jgi:hypothetical protein
VADTGLPYELPFPLPTDLVKDGAGDIQALAEATAAALDTVETTDASKLTEGTLPSGRISGAYGGLTGTGTLGTGAISSGFGNVNIGTSTFTGNGSGLTTLNASNVSSGTLNTARLPAGTVIAVKHALFTGTQTNSTAAGANFAVTNLSITHSLANAGNTLIIFAYFGAAGSTEQRGRVGIAVADTGTLIGIGDGSGSRRRVAAGGEIATNDGVNVVTMPSISFGYAPGSTSSRTYTVRAINIRGETQTLYINRSQNDSNAGFISRASSGLTIMEVKG